MTSDGDNRARSLLQELEDRLATHDLDQMAELFTDDVVLIGDAVENFDRDSTVAYLKAMADMGPTVRWQWDHVASVLSTRDVLCFAAAGTMTFNDETGTPLADGERFRVTCLAVQTSDGWRLKHFHGSEPTPE
jgi:uncharacterized protein (TIGR02246 family)